VVDELRNGLARNAAITNLETKLSSTDSVMWCAGKITKSAFPKVFLREITLNPSRRFLA
jgi:hypothetical protein